MHRQQGILGTQQPPVAFADSSFKQFNKQLLDIGESVQSTGLDSLIKEWPTVVVCGETSSGKSSLLQRIARVELPRDDQACTRCPIELRMRTRSSNDKEPWACTVKVRFAYDEHQKPLPSPYEVPVGEIITDRKDVGDRVAKGQEMALSAGAPGQDEKKLEFTKNSVILEMRGEEVNLTLVDLPGLIQSTFRDDENNERQVISSVEQMTLDYISNPKNIIVAVISCQSNLQNQKVHKMALAAERGSERTLGVLTKADQIQEGCHERWIDIMHNRIIQLHLGFFLVRNPPQIEVKTGVTPSDADMAEQNEFQAKDALRPLTTDPLLQKRLGVPVLISTLSKLLMEKTMEHLPGLAEMVNAKLQSVEQELQDMPPKFSSGERVSLLEKALRMLASSADPFKLDTVTSEEKAQMHGAMWAARHAFCSNILGNRPAFVMANGNIIDFREDHEPPTASQPVPVQSVADRIKSSRSNELATDVPYPARAAVIRFFMSSWEKQGLEFVDAMAQAYEDALIDLIYGYPLLQSCPRLASAFEDAVLLLLEEKKAFTRQRIHELASMELSADPFTVMDSYFTHSKFYAQKHISASLGGSCPEAQDVMTRASAFFKVASKRYIESVSQATQALFLKSASQDMEHHLRSSIQSIAQEGGEGSVRWQESDNVLDMVAYEPEVEQERSALEQQRNSLKRVRQLIRKIEKAPAQRAAVTA